MFLGLSSDSKGCEPDQSDLQPSLTFLWTPTFHNFPAKIRQTSSTEIVSMLRLGAALAAFL
jgi:hypothetical protein